MSKLEKKWDYLSEWEKKKAYIELDQLLKVREQREQLKKKIIEERIKKIKQDFPGVRI